WPLSLAVHPGDAAGPQPDLTHPPLYSFLLALLFGALGARDGTAALASALCYLLLIPLVYLLAARWFNRTVAVTSVLVTLCWRQTIGYAITGLPVLLVTLLVTLLLILLHRADQDQQRLSHLGIAGAVLGLCYLAEYT